MSGWALFSGYGRSADTGLAAGTSAGIQMTTGASNTKGAWVQLTSGLAFDAKFSMLHLWSGGNGNFLAVDLGLGGAGSEVAIAQNLVFTLFSSFSVGWYPLPILIPAGVRVAARAQSSASSDTIEADLLTFDGDFDCGPAGSVVDTYGFTAASTTGTSIAAAASANTKGAWVQLTSGTSNDIRGFSVGFTNPISQGGGQGALDIGIGPAGQEVVAVANIPTGYSGGIGSFQQPIEPTPWYPFPIAAGTRIAARYANNAASKTTSITLYGSR